MSDSVFALDTVVTTTGMRPVEELTEANLVTWARGLPAALWAQEIILACGERASWVADHLSEYGVFAHLFSIHHVSDLDGRFELAVMR